MTTSLASVPRTVLGLSSGSVTRATSVTCTTCTTRTTCTKRTKGRGVAPWPLVCGARDCAFDFDRVMVCENLKVLDRQALRPWGLFTMLRFEKTFRTDEKKA